MGTNRTAVRRPAGRAVRAAAGVAIVSALALTAAACGGTPPPGDQPGGDTGSTAAPDFTQRGPIKYVQGKDTSGNLQNQIDAWNKDNPDEKVELVELPDNADQQRAQMIQNAQTRSPEYTVLSLDVVWTAEFAANSYVDPLPADQFDMASFLQPTVDGATYFDQLYGIPGTGDGGLLYYRSDLLKEAGVAQPPTTWQEMKDACAAVKSKVSDAKDMGCFAGQYQKYEGLTVNVAEAVDSAGGALVDAQGVPTANSPQSVEGLNFLGESFADGTIPKEAITWQEEQGRQAFQDGKLIFHRNWPYAFALMSKSDGSSKVNGKFEVAPLPGKDGPGVSSLGGHNFAISSFAENKGTALDFIKYMTSAETQKANTLATSLAPTLTALYDDPELNKKYPYMPTLKASIESAKPRPKVVQYGDVTLAIQDATYPVMQGDSTAADAMNQLQPRLEQLIQR